MLWEQEPQASVSTGFSMYALDLAREIWRLNRGGTFAVLFEQNNKVDPNTNLSIVTDSDFPNSNISFGTYKVLGLEQAQGAVLQHIFCCYPFQNGAW